MPHVARRFGLRPIGRKARCNILSAFNLLLMASLGKNFIRTVLFPLRNSIGTSRYSCFVRPLRRGTGASSRTEAHSSPATI
ncbi:MAG: hypothetical protein NTV12_09755 [Verrucomicrobia bacterium]|nr:hypothetical protein [Verrucomicrobiota bacterium]